MGETARDVAVRQASKRVAALLAGDDPNDESAALAVQAGGMSLHEAVYRRDVDAMRALIALRADVDEVSDDTAAVGSLAGLTPLGLAVRGLDLPALEILLQAGANPNARNNDGRTAISYLFTYDTDIHLLAPAFREGAVGRALARMATYGWDPTAAVDADGDTLTGWALKSPYGRAAASRQTFAGLVVAEMVQQGDDVNHLDRDGRTPLMLACLADIGDVEDVVLTLLEAGADVTAIDAGGASVLHNVARRTYPVKPNPGLVDLLFDFGTPDVSAVDNTGQTALDIATAAGDDQLVNLLLARI
jgi:ankyrin repeat protein